MKELDVYASQTWSSLSPLQERLTLEGVRRINRIGDPLEIHHVVLNFGPGTENYSRVMARVIKSAEESQDRVHYHGLARLPADTTNTGFHNSHSGGHFTPEINQLYGVYLAEILGRAGIGLDF